MLLKELICDHRFFKTKRLKTLLQKIFKTCQFVPVVKEKIMASQINHSKLQVKHFKVNISIFYCMALFEEQKTVMYASAKSIGCKQ